MKLFESWLKGDTSTYSKDIILVENGVVKCQGHIEAQNYFKKFADALLNLEISMSNEYCRESDKQSFTWRLSGIHKGILNGLMPTSKYLEINGGAFVDLLNNTITRIELFYDKQQVEYQVLAPTQYTLNSDTIFNNLNGQGEKIYRLLLSTRSELTDSKHALIRGLRLDALQAPDINLLNKEVEKTKLACDLYQTFVTSDEGRQIELFVYTPKNEQNSKNLPTILHLHGGGWCMGSPEAYDLVSRKLADSCRARVICPRYRLSPEHPYPAGFNDCCDVYKLLRNGYLIQGIEYDKDKIIVAGDSAGGSFAAALTLRMHDESVSVPDALLLLSPATDMRLENYHSYNQYTKNNIMIDQGLIGLIRGAYVNGDLWDHPYVSPMRGDLRSFPKTLIMIGEEDPLHDENVAFANKLSQDSLFQPKVVIGRDMPHHYHTFIGLSSEVDTAYKSIGEFVQSTFQ